MDPCKEWPELARTSRQATDRGERWREIVVKYLECYRPILGELKDNPDRAAARAEELTRSAAAYGFVVPNERFEATIKKTAEQMLALAAKYEKPVAKPPKKQVDRKADPVIMWSGELVYEVEDLRVRGAGLDFAFVRTYKHQADYQGPCGHRWDHVYNAWLRVSADEAVLSMGDLSTRGFLRHPRFGDPGFDYWVPPDGTEAVLLEEGDAFVVRRPDGTRLRFELDPSIQSFIFRLARIEDRHGNFLSFQHDERGVTRVAVNGPSRFVVFGYDDEGRVISLTDHSGRRWRYAYDDFADLAAVIAPTGDAVLYEYSSPSASIERHHRLIRVTDPSRRIHLEVAYGQDGVTVEDDRVVRQRQGGGEFLFAYEDLLGDPFAAEEADQGGPSTPVRATTMIGRGGHQQRHEYNSAGNLLRTHEVAVIGGRARRLVAQYRYDADGSLIASRSPEGVVTQYLYGREVFLRRHGLSDAGSAEALAVLDHQTRQGFARLLATVRRAHPPAAGFDDVFAVHPDDIVEKLTYEAAFGQVTSRSDPRFTRTADPSGPEHPLHEAMLTRWRYEGPTKLLAEIRWPAAENADGTSSRAVVERFLAYDERGRLLRQQAATGLVSETVRFGATAGPREGFVHQLVVDPAGLALTTRFELDELGRTVAIVRPRGTESGDGRFVEQIALDSLDRPSRFVASAPFGFETRKTYDPTGMLVREERDAVDENGAPIEGGTAVRTWQYDEDLLLIAETVGGADPHRRAVTRHRYDAFGARAITFHPAGNRTRFRYDARGLPTAQTHGYGTPEAARRSCDFDGDGRLFRSRDARNHVTTAVHDVFGRVVATEDPSGHVVRQTFSKTDQVLLERVFERRGTDYVLVARSARRYDALDRLIEEVTNRFDTPPLAADLEHDFVEGPGPGERIVWHTFYDPAGRVARRVEVNRGVEARFEYDRAGRLSAEIDPAGHRTAYTYDRHGNVVRGDRFEDGQVFSWEARYDELDRVVARTDELGNTTRFAYDSLNRLVRTIDPLGNIREARYDLRGLLTAEVCQRTSTGLAAGTALPPAIMRYEHDANGNRTAVIDPLGRRTQLEYDALDRRVVKVDAAGARTTYDYDRDGHPVRVLSPSGRELVRTVDPHGRVLTVEARGTPGPGALAERFEYDAFGRTVLEENDHLRVALRRDSTGQAVQERLTWLMPEAGLAAPLVLSRRFDPAGRLIELAYPSGRQIRYERDPLGGISRVTQVAGGASYPGRPGLGDPRPVVAKIERAGRRRCGVVFANEAQIRYRHDGAGRLIEIAHRASAGPLLTLQYLCDGANQVRLVNELSGAGRRGHLCGYDSLGQLVRVKPRADLPLLGADVDVTAFEPFGVPPPTPLPGRQQVIDAVLGSLALTPGDEDFLYDLAGNRLRERRETGPLDYEVNELDEYTKVGAMVVEHDSDGNVSAIGARRFGYDAWSRLVTVDEAGQAPLRFFHDARGRRIAQSRGTDTIVLVYDDDRLIEERTGSMLVAQWVNDDGLDRPFQIATGGEDLYYHADLQGSVRLLTGDGGAPRARYDYSAFGIPASHQAAPYNPFGYTGRRYDRAIECYDFRARQYEPRLGRFLQRDSVETPTGAYVGAYVYAGNNPLAFNDPLGTSRKEVVKGDATANTPTLKGDADQPPPTSPPTPPPAPPPPPQPVNTVLRGVMSEDEIAETKDRIRAYDDAIQQLDYQDKQLTAQVAALKTKIFEAERWVWPNWGTAATVVDWGEKILGCYVGKVMCAAEIGSGVVGQFDKDAGRAIGYGAAATQGGKALLIEGAADAGAWGFQALHERSERRKKAEGDRLRQKLKAVEANREQIKTKVQWIKQQQQQLRQKLVEDQNKTIVVPVYPDGSIGL